MATTLPLPPYGAPIIDPTTGGMSEVWRRYWLAIEQAVATGGAPSDARYWVSTANTILTNEENIGLLSTGYLKITSAIGIAVPSTVTAIPAGDLSGTVSVAHGGTGLTSGTSGGVLGFTATGTVASSAALGQNALVIGGGAGATPTALGSLGTTATVLHGNAAGAPTFGAVALASDVSGTLPVANGGTGAATLAANNVLLGNGTSALQVVAPGTSGNVLTSNGTTWASAAATSGGASQIAFQAGNPGIQAQNTTQFYGQSFYTTDERQAEIVLATAMTITKLYAYASIAPASGQTIVVTLRKNEADTAITCTITGTGAATAASNDLAHSVSFSAGDRMSVKAVTSATTGNVQFMASVAA